MRVPCRCLETGRVETPPSRDGEGGVDFEAKTGEEVPGVDAGEDFVDLVEARRVEVHRVCLGGQPGEGVGRSGFAEVVDFSMHARRPVHEDAPRKLQEKAVKAVLGAVEDPALVVVIRQVRDPLPEVVGSRAVGGGFHAIGPDMLESDAEPFDTVLQFRKVQDIQRRGVFLHGAPGHRLLGGEEVQVREQHRGVPNDQCAHHGMVHTRVRRTITKFSRSVLYSASQNT